MRYRRLGYRYTMVMTTGDLAPLAEIFRVGGPGVVLAQPQWRPAADVYETPAAIVVVVLGFVLWSLLVARGLASHGPAVAEAVLLT